jgi:hypothetical protein
MSTDAISPLRQRMIEDMSARKLNPHTQRSHISSCKRFAAYLKRSPGTATADEIRLFQLHLTETGTSICNRNRIMTGLRFLFRVTLRRLDLAAEIYHIKEPQKIPLVMSPDEAKRLLAMAGNPGPPARESASNRCVFVVSSLAGIVLKLPRVSYPAKASAATRDAKCLGAGRERPQGLSRPFSSRRMWSVSAGF